VNIDLRKIYVLDKDSLCIGRDYIPKTLGQIDIAKHQFDFKMSLEEARDEILQLKQVDLIQINKWIVNPSLQLEYLSLEARRMEDMLPYIENRSYTFEENDIAGPSRLVVQLVSKCMQCIEQGKAKTSGNK
jgi:hypothetical protein